MKFSNIVILLILFSFALKQNGAYSAEKKAKSKKTSVAVRKDAALVIDADSGKVLYQSYANSKRHPASLTKLMTLYLTFDALKKGTIQLSDTVTVSKNAASQPRMNIALKTNDSISIQTLISSLVVVSANDSAVVLAEKIGKTEYSFAKLMTTRAHELGMKNTTFKNASGLHSPSQVTTANDMAKLMMALKRDFPEYYSMLSELKFSYKGIEYFSHTNVMKNYKGVKAAKTGYIRASGFNLIVGAEKGKKNIVAVVMGGVTAKARDNQMVQLLNKNLVTTSTK